MLEVFGFFSLGFMGGFSHCIFMCNPFVLYISSRFAPSKPGYLRFLIPQIKYSLGRALTYSFLGIVFGSISNLMGLFSNMIILQKAISILAGIFIISYSITELTGLKLFSKIEDNVITQKIRNLISKFQFGSPFLTGIVLGFLPCGLLYGSLIAVSSINNPLKSGLSMAFFGVGTSFSLIILAIFGNIILKYRTIFRILNFLVMFGMGIFFIFSGIKF